MRHNRTIMYLAGFLASMPFALTSYINSSFLFNYVGEYYISILYIIASILAVIGMLKMPSIITRLGNRQTALLFSLLSLFSLIILSFGNIKLFIIPAFILYFLSFNLIIITFDIFIENFSEGSSIGRFRGFYLTICNLAWVISQLIAGSIITKSSFQGIYLLATLFMILVSVIFIFLLRDFQEPKYQKYSISKTIRTFIANKNLSKIYLINFILKLFYVWMVIYTPIYLNQHLGFNWAQIGIIFSIMLLPFVILEFPLGKLSDRIGEKKILLFGFIVIIISTTVIPFIKTPTIYLWALVLLFTRIGAVSIEIMTESYFFKSINEESSGLISFFRNTTPLAYIIGPAMAIPILFFTPTFGYLFFILSIILLSGLLISLRLKDVK